MKGRVLVVDDDLDLRETLAAALEAEGYRASASASGEAALRALREEEPEVLLTDVRMKGLDGLALCRRVQELDAELPVIVMTAFGDLETAVGAIRAGAYDFLPKPFETEALAIALERALAHRRLRAEVRSLRSRLERVEPFEDLLGESPPMRELCDLIARAAPSDVTVLLSGETGAGKEVVARALHARSRRAGGPFVAINCAAVPEALLESELFGHAKGAFTGASEARRGLFLAAEGGTLFLDEVGDMPLGLQAKLLRVLEDRRVRPLGGERERELDVRVVAASHVDLERAVEEGSFRRDLLYRLDVLGLEVPPLRARGNDVLLLAQHFLERGAERARREPPRLSPQVAERLLAHSWPGNVRELLNCMERALALAGPEVRLEDLPPALREERAPAPREGAVELISLAEVERRHALAVLEALEGNKARAAQVLGIGRKTLYRKLEQWEPS